ncbi:hypothetical protein [Spirosoma arcticum]
MRKQPKQKPVDKQRPLVSVPPIVDVPSVTSKELPVVSAPPRFKRSAHFSEQSLMYTSEEKFGQLSLFDTLMPETQSTIVNYGVSVDLINQRGIGIKLTKGEYKLLICIQKLLQQKSQTTDKDADDYFIGDTNPNDKSPLNGMYNGNLSVVGNRKTATITVTLYELTKEYNGGEVNGGRDIDIVYNLLLPLANDPKKKALIKYSREQKGNKGKVVDEIEGFQQLIEIWTSRRKIYNQEDVLTSEKTEVQIFLNPIFRDQIESKYIEFPDDIIRQVHQACGSHNVPVTVWKFIEYLAHARSNKLKNDEAEIGQEKLYWKLAEEQMRDPKRGRAYIKKYVDKALEVAKSINLLTDYELTPAKDGTMKYVFKINRKW